MYLCSMYFTSVIRFSPEHGRELPYYKIKESFRDVAGRVHTRLMLTPGYMPDFSTDEIVQVRIGLSYLWQESAVIPGERRLFEADPRVDFSEKVRRCIERFWESMKEKGAIDAARDSYDESLRKSRRLIDVNTISHRDCRDIGAENVCLQAIRELQLDTFLRHEGWTQRRIDATLAALIVRTVCPCSEWASLRVHQENSAAMELLTGQACDAPTQREVYAAAPSLYALKEKLERHLCSRTDSLFNLTNKVMLFDLTNFYFEGRKEASAKAKFGRSKEKRSDCRLLVLALAINTEGFIRYSSILAGNTADPDSLPDMIDNIIAKNPTAPNPEEKVLVVMDAGIATEENLRLVKERGYNYLCVSRHKPDKVETAENGRTVTVYDTLHRAITLAEVAHEDGGDYYLRVNSPAKALTERSMNEQWRERFETEMKKAREALTKKGGTKNYDKVVERVGRAMGRYPSVSKYYLVEYERSSEHPAQMADIKWTLKVPAEAMETRYGTYFLRTNVATLDEKSTWDYYNLIREIETSNRQLKTDLSLRPIHHQKDENSDAHLFFGLLSYWIVNTVRYKLKQHGTNHYWTEIKRILSTQKAITTDGTNPLGERVTTRLCSDASDNAADLYRQLGYNPVPFRRRVTIIDSSPPQDQ